MHGVVRVRIDLIFRSFSDATFSVDETDARGRRAITDVIGNDLHIAVAENTHARVRGAQVDADRRSFGHLSPQQMNGVALTYQKKPGGHRSVPREVSIVKMPAHRWR